MPKKRTLKMMPVKKSDGTVKQVRRQSNEELMHASILHFGFVRLRIQPCIMTYPDRLYAGYRGAAFVTDFKSVADAKKFVESLSKKG